ncbi:MAG: nicotinate-nucleotide adenylyltransferase [Bacteroidetes bacterium]|nr:MAG: nicotinate-nucleotide adenylyltransferase [Bacteroidota bacterium]
MKVGLLFGSFNPVHLGHLAVVRYWLNETDLNQVWLVVSPQNPHKPVEELAPPQERLRMVELATQGDPWVRPSAVEFQLPRPSYTIQTLGHLRQAYPHYAFVLLLGSDAAASLPTWKEGDRLLREWPLWVYPRKGADAEQLPPSPHLRFFPEAPRIDLSATQIRQYLRQGRSIRYWVPSAVEAYIYARGLYGTRPLT